MLLLDLGPDPVSLGVGLVLLLIVVLTISAALIVGFVFLLKRLKRQKADGASRIQPSRPNQ